MMMIKIENFKPLLNRVLIQKILNYSSNQSKLIFSQKFLDEQSKLGKVVAVGEGRINEKTGKLIPMLVNIGDIVVLPEYGGMKIPINDNNKQNKQINNEYILCHDTDIPAIISQLNNKI